MRSKVILICLLILIPVTGLFAQDEKEQEVRDIISFLEYMLNTLGDPETSARDKDVIVTESYAKVFRDSTVQIEDDLDENRDVITNKDVQAYLKDVEFFFKEAKFEFEWQDMEVSENEAGETYYKVNLLRNLEAIGIMGDTVSQTLPRYVEINLNPEEQDLRIVSIYTNELNQDDVWMEWWQNLSLEWQAIFKRKVGSIDDLEINQIKKLEDIEELDLAGNGFIADIEPLSRITQLKRLNLSHTAVTDVSPIRNLNKIESLDISHTTINSIASLRYARKLRELHIDHSPIDDISVVSRMPALETLTLNYTLVSDLEPLSGLNNLMHLEISNTEMNSLEPLNSLTGLETLNVSATPLQFSNDLSGLHSLKELNADSTLIESIEGLSALKELVILSINHTPVDDLSPLSDLPELKRIYCDFTQISLEDSRYFMNANPEVLIIFESDELLSWWNELPPEWKDIFKNYVDVSTSAQKEELAQIVRLDSINVAKDKYITGIEPLQRLIELEYVNAAETGIADISALENLEELQYVDISSTMVSDITPLSDLYNLKFLDASETSVDSLGLVRILPNLELLDVDNTNIQDTSVINMARMRPQTLIVYKTNRLTDWWSGLSEEWQIIFRDQMDLPADPGSLDLHRLISTQAVSIADKGIADLYPLTEFIRLKELQVTGTRVRTLEPLRYMDGLEVLEISANPLEDVTALKELADLKKLDISNTPVSDLKMLSSLYRLEYLNCSGTQIRKLNGLERLGMLSYLDCSNTTIKKLDPVSKLSLNTLKCFNTRISSRRIDDFKQLNPECDVSFY